MSEQWCILLKTNRKKPEETGKILGLVFPGLWHSVHIDDLRGSTVLVLDIPKLQDVAISQLFKPQDLPKGESGEKVLGEVGWWERKARRCALCCEDRCLGYCPPVQHLPLGKSLGHICWTEYWWIQGTVCCFQGQEKTVFPQGLCRCLWNMSDSVYPGFWISLLSPGWKLGLPLVDHVQWVNGGWSVWLTVCPLEPLPEAGARETRIDPQHTMHTMLPAFPTTTSASEQ